MALEILDLRDNFISGLTKGKHWKKFIKNAVVLLWNNSISQKRVEEQLRNP